VSGSVTRREDERDFLRLTRGPEPRSEWVVMCLREADRQEPPGESEGGTKSTGEETVSQSTSRISSIVLPAALTTTSVLNLRTLANGLAISAVGERELGVENLV